MATGGRNYWKIFGIIVIIALIVLVAFLVGRGCEKKKDEGNTTSTTTSQPAPSSSGQSGDESATSETPTNTVVDGPPTVVSVRDEIGPCVGGFQDVTHTTVYSDGTSASSISRQACGFVPVPEP
ncbi:MAG: hypothetical protein WC828_08355 [Thermoleophilia bacterium]|jgi:hypothetical protein